MPDYVPGRRYPLTAPAAAAIEGAGYPLLHCPLDVSRGRRFVRAPGDWECWLTDGRRVDVSAGIHGLIVSPQRGPDPERPEALPC